MSSSGVQAEVLSNAVRWASGIGNLQVCFCLSSLVSDPDLEQSGFAVDGSDEAAIGGC
jgi:hypothetical protein